MSMGGGSPSGNTNSTSTTEPWSGQKPSLMQQFSSANGLFFGGGTGATPESWKVGDRSFTSADEANQFAAQNPGADGTSPTVQDIAATDGTPGTLGKGTYNPQFFPGAGAAPNTTVVGFNPQEQAGLNNVLQASSNVGDYFGNVTQASNNILDPNFLTSNTGNGVYQQVAAAAPNNPALGAFQNIANSAGNNPANPGLGLQQAEAQAGAIPLAGIANGSQLGTSNPAFQNLADSISASVLPQVESQFIKGGNLKSPMAAYAASNGLASALAGPAYQWANQASQNQINAANTLTNTGEAAGANLGNISNTGVGNAIAATQGASGAYQGGLNALLQAGQGMSNNYSTEAQIQNQNMANAPAFANAVNSNAMVPFQVGQAQQTQAQNELGGQIQNYNYTQNLPLNMLNAFAGAINGNYGGSSTLTQPYYTNPTGNALGTLSSTAGIANGLFGNGGLFR